MILQSFYDFIVIAVKHINQLKSHAAKVYFKVSFEKQRTSNDVHSKYQTMELDVEQGKSSRQKSLNT